MKSKIEEIKEIEQNIQNKVYNEKIGFEYIKGNKKILFSAPHSVEQFREGAIKCGESRTAGIVNILAKSLGCFGIFKTYNYKDDANYDEESYFKDEIEKIIKEEDIKLLIDLHIMSPKRKHNIDIGTGKGSNIYQRNDILKKLEVAFDEIENVEIDYMFTAEYRNTVSADISKRTKIPCFQIESNWNILSDEISLLKMINGLEKFVDKFNEDGELI